MITESSITAVGVIGLVIGLLLFAGGVTLLILSIISTIKGKRRIGGIVGGAIMLIAGMSVGFTFGMFALTAGFITNSASSAEIAAMNSGLQSALKEKDGNALYSLCAEESYSGTPLELYDADKICSYIEGDVKSVTYEPTSLSAKNKTHFAEYKYTVVTEDGEKYTLYVHSIESSDTEEYVGIQHIKMYDGMKVLCEVGTAPVLN